MDDLQRMRDDYSDVLMAMNRQQLTDLDAALTAAIQALLTMPMLPAGSFAALHMERLKGDLDGLRAAIEQIG